MTKTKNKTKIRVKDVITSVRKTINKRVVKNAEKLLEEKIMALEKAKSIVRKLEKEIADIQEMDLTDVIAYLEDEK